MAAERNTSGQGYWFLERCKMESDLSFALCLLSEPPPAKGALLFMGENGLKVLLTGDSGVGKSSVLVRFTDDHFDAE